MENTDNDKTEKVEKLDATEMLQAKLFETELRALRAELNAKQFEMNSFIDKVWAKHNLVRGVDRIREDGVIARGQQPAAEKSTEVK